MYTHVFPPRRSSDLHFYITFMTHAPGVAIPGHLIAKYPDEMTIVLQNRFWDLTVEEDHFSVGLSFNQTPSILTIPYAAITAFVDRSEERRVGTECASTCTSRRSPHP